MWSLQKSYMYNFSKNTGYLVTRCNYTILFKIPMFYLYYDNSENMIQNCQRATYTEIRNFVYVIPRGEASFENLFPQNTCFNIKMFDELSESDHASQLLASKISTYILSFFFFWYI